MSQIVEPRSSNMFQQMCLSCGVDRNFAWGRPLRVYISAPRQKTFFIRCVREVAEKRGDKSIYPPDVFRDLDDKQILEKVMRELRDSHLIVMDVSMRNFNGEWYPSSGVMMELGVIVEDPTKGLNSVYFFCDELTDRHHLPPMIPRIEVQKYSENDENLKKLLRKALDGFERKAPERLRQALKAQTAAKIMCEIRETSI